MLKTIARHPLWRIALAAILAPLTLTMTGGVASRRPRGTARRAHEASASRQEHRQNA
jgi:hypothetical protein